MTALGLRSGRQLRLSRRRRPRPTSFLPPRLPGLAFWYEARLSGYGGGTWHDLSGQGNHATQATPARRPDKITDGAGRRALRFDGVDDALSVANPPDLSLGLTLFVVYRVRAPADYRGIFSAAAATGVDHEQFFTLQYEQVANRRVQLYGRSVQPNQVVVRSADSTEAQYSIATFDDDGVDVELRGLSGLAGDTSTLTPFGTPAAMILGARYQQGAPFSFGAVDLYEVGLYNRELSVAERGQLETYLRQRHELTWNPHFIGEDLAWFHDVDASNFALSGNQVEQWADLGLNGRHWVAGSTGKPMKSIDPEGRNVVRFDGLDDLLSLAGDLPTLEPFTIGLVYRMRERSDFAGALSTTPPAGTDHSDFWTFRNASGGSMQMQLYGRSTEADPLELSLVDSGSAQVAVWSIGDGTAGLRDTGGTTTDTYGGSFGAPNSILLGGRYDGAPFGHAAIDVLATLGAARALSTTDQQRLVEWASAKWSL